MTYSWVLFSAGIGFVTAFLLFRPRSFTKNRVIPAKARRRRDAIEEVRAVAFAILYKGHADSTFPHYVTAEEQADLYTEVRQFLRDRRDKLGETYTGWEVMDASEEQLAMNVVDEAIDLFKRV